MIITSRNLLRHLLSRGLVSPDSVVDGDLIVVDASGRNRNFKVLRKNNPSFFVKQIRNWNNQAVAMLQCEAACYWLARNDPDFSALEPFIPELYDFDQNRQALTTALISDGEDLLEHLRRTGKISTPIAGELGRCFGRFHRESDRLLNSQHCSVFPKQIPWILSAERRNSHPFKELSPATSQLFDHVESTSLAAALDELRNDWRVSTLMHGDMRLENCILVQTSTDAPNLKIVDWELADLGDPCWDVGSIIQAFLATHINSIPPLEGKLNLRTLLMQPSLTNLQPAIRSFWESYAGEFRNSKESNGSMFQRCLSYGAARMVQSAYESMQFTPHLSRNALHLLEVSSDILTKPTSAAEQLLK